MHRPNQTDHTPCGTALRAFPEAAVAIRQAFDSPALSNRSALDVMNAQADVDQLYTQIDRQQREISDLRNALLTSNEHGDLLQEHLYRISSSLTAEVRERQASEAKLRQLLQ